MKASETLKRDNLLVEFLREHRGAKNCVSNKEITKYLDDKGYAVKVGSTHGIVRKVMFERT